MLDGILIIFFDLATMWALYTIKLEDAQYFLDKYLSMKLMFTFAYLIWR